MIIANAQDKLLTMGDLYLCTDDVDFLTIPALTATNQATVKGILDGFNFATIGHIKEFSITHSKEDEKSIRAGNCWVGEVAKTVTKTPKYSWTWLDVNNRPIFDKFMGIDSLSVAGTLVTGATQVIASGFTYNKFYPITHQNGDGSVLSITTVVGATNGALVANTDYVLVNQGGVYGITILDSATVTTTSQIITITYSYTPSASSIDGYNIEQSAIPYVLCKFVSCKNAINDTQGIQDTVYLWKAVIDGDMVEQYIDQSETDFAGSEVSLVWVLGGGYMKSKATVAL